MIFFIVKLNLIQLLTLLLKTCEIPKQVRNDSWFNSFLLDCFYFLSSMKIYSNSINNWPLSTACPFVTAIDLITPARGESKLFSIFIASKINKLSPS